MTHGRLVICIGLLLPWLAIAAPADGDGAAPNGFAAQGDGSVVAAPGGMVWMRCSLGQQWHAATRRCTGAAATLVWRDAARAAESVNAQRVAGYGDWRLPQLQELAGLVDERSFAPAIRADMFPDTAPERYWSATPASGFPGYGWTVHFADGSTGFDIRLFANRVRLVRGAAGR